MDKRNYLPYNILDLTQYGFIINVTIAQMTSIVQDAVVNGKTTYTLTNIDETDISNKIINTDVPIDVLRNIPNKIQRIKANVLSRTGYMNVDIVDENKVYSFSQFWFESAVCVNANIKITDENVLLEVMLIQSNL